MSRYNCVVSSVATPFFDSLLLLIPFPKTVGAHIEAFSESHPRAFKNILFASSENHLQEYLMGRQLLTVAVVFLISRLTTFLSWQTFPFSDTVVPAGFKGAFYDSGMLGVVVVTIAGQLTPQLLCETYPVRTLNIKFVGAVTIGTCVGVEKLGITHFSYALSAFLVWFFKRVNPRAFGGQSFSPAGQAKELSSTLKRLLDEDHLISSLAEDDDVYKAVDSVKLLSRETFRKGSDSLDRFPPIVGGKHYASPAEIATQLLEAGLASEQIPRFLLSPTDPQHIPPHVVAIKLMGFVVNSQRFNLHIVEWHHGSL